MGREDFHQRPVQEILRSCPVTEFRKTHQKERVIMSCSLSRPMTYGMKLEGYACTHRTGGYIQVTIIFVRPSSLASKCRVERCERFVETVTVWSTHSLQMGDREVDYEAFGNFLSASCLSPLEFMVTVHFYLVCKPRFATRKKGKIMDNVPSDRRWDRIISTSESVIHGDCRLFYIHYCCK